MSALKSRILRTKPILILRSYHDKYSRLNILTVCLKNIGYFEKILMSLSSLYTVDTIFATEISRVVALIFYFCRESIASKYPLRKIESFRADDLSRSLRPIFVIIFPSLSIKARGKSRLGQS